MRLKYGKPEAIRLYDKSGKIIEPKNVDPGMPLPTITKEKCGDNRWNAS